MLRFCRMDVTGILAAMVLVASSAHAQIFTTAAKVIPIQTATKPN